MLLPPRVHTSVLFRHTTPYSIVYSLSVSIAVIARGSSINDLPEGEDTAPLVDMLYSCYSVVLFLCIK